MQQAQPENDMAQVLLNAHSKYRNAITEEIAAEIEAVADKRCACEHCCWYRNTAGLVRLFKCH